MLVTYISIKIWVQHPKRSKKALPPKNLLTFQTTTISFGTSLRNVGCSCIEVALSSNWFCMSLPGYPKSQRPHSAPWSSQLLPVYGAPVPVFQRWPLRKLRYSQLYHKHLDLFSKLIFCRGFLLGVSNCDDVFVKNSGLDPNVFSYKRINWSEETWSLGIWNQNYCRAKRQNRSGWN